MKRFLIIVCVLMTICVGSMAEIIPGEEIYQDFYEWTGIKTTPAVVLCESLSICNDRDGRGEKVATLLGTGGKQIVPVIEAWDGWAQIYFHDGSEKGWVRSDYLLMNPAVYVTEESTAVYAYDDYMAPKVGLLEMGEKLPVILEKEEWVLVSIRNAAGWIRKTAKERATKTSFQPALVKGLAAAELTLNGEVKMLTDSAKLAELETLLVNAEDTYAIMAGCPFTAQLTLKKNDGTQIEMLLATDSCCIYRIDGHDYKYARHLYDPEIGGLTNQCLFDLFGIELWPEN